MIYIGIDDTDTLDSPGTNQLARALVASVSDRFSLRHIVRHQLFFDPRVPYTSKNGSASIVLEPLRSIDTAELVGELRRGMLERYVAGSDPGLCVAEAVPVEVATFGLRCQHELVTQADARAIATTHGIHLEGLGGTQGGVIGALAAVGLVSLGDDGRVIAYQAWPDDLSGAQEIAVLQARDVVVRSLDSHETILSGWVDLGKRLRPNLRGGRPVLFVEPAAASGCAWKALKLV